MSQSPHELFEGENSSLNRTYRQATVRAIKDSMSQSTAQQPESYTATLYRLPVNHKELFEMLAEARKEAKSSLLKEVREGVEGLTTTDFTQKNYTNKPWGVDLDSTVITKYITKDQVLELLKNMEKEE